MQESQPRGYLDDDGVDHERRTSCHLFKEEPYTHFIVLLFCFLLQALRAEYAVDYTRYDNVRS